MDKQYINGHINQPMKEILLNQTIAVFNLPVLENTGATKNCCCYVTLKILTATVKCFVIDRKSTTTVDNVVVERSKRKILDIFNNVEHLFRALTTGGHSTVEFPPGWPSEHG